MKIKGTFTMETGRWDDTVKTWVDRRYETTEKDLRMVIWSHERGDVLRFIGGPTGHEAYFISTLLGIDRPGGRFCICFGTINTWAHCTVPWDEVVAFLKEKGYIK